jgi:hypothetical protein
MPPVNLTRCDDDDDDVQGHEFEGKAICEPQDHGRSHSKVFLKQKFSSRANSGFSTANLLKIASEMQNEMFMISSGDLFCVRTGTCFDKSEKIHGLPCIQIYVL